MSFLGIAQKDSELAGMLRGMEGKKIFLILTVF